METETTWSDGFVRAALHAMRGSLLTVVAEAHSNASTQTFHRQGNGSIIAQLIGVTDDVRARLVHPQHHQHSLLLRKRIAIEKIANDISHQRQITGVAAKLDFLLLHQSAETEKLDTPDWVFKSEAGRNEPWIHLGMVKLMDTSWDNCSISPCGNYWCSPSS